MTAQIKNNKLIIELDLTAPTPSKSGKTLLVASSKGIKETDAKVDGKNVSIGVNAFIEK